LQCHRGDWPGDTAADDHGCLYTGHGISFQCK
jgi:hypothetical protein